MKTKKMTIWDVIAKHKLSTQLSSRYVGLAPTYEWTGLATKELQNDLDKVHVSYTHFRSDVKGQPVYGKFCLCFVTFGDFPPELKNRLL